ncbi:MAG: hypothetical protein HYW49_08615 [Deltaproteobacteria bacterium]|nr:hypothetical protein [Deltaproteobacteria bacterium]
MSFRSAFFRCLAITAFLLSAAHAEGSALCPIFLQKFDGLHIPQSQIDEAKTRIDPEWLSETLFLVPRNDGEALRAVNILGALRAPHFKVSAQTWGATLDREPLPEDLLKKVKRVVVFEMPGPRAEERLRQKGLEVVVLDHHFYGDVDRRDPRSSLEQLMELLRWPASATDLAIAINDRSYVPGLKKAGLMGEMIFQIRKYDLQAQGEKDIERSRRRAQDLIPKLEKRGGVYIMTESDVSIGGNYVKQELAIQSPDGLSSVLELFAHKIGFSGKPAVAKKLLAFDFTALGYAKGSYAQYGGGDAELSMFFGFKPKAPPDGEKDLIPRRVIDEILKLLE